MRKQDARFELRLPEELKEKAEKVAEERDITLAEMIRLYLQGVVKREAVK